MKASFLCYRFSLFLQSPCVSKWYLYIPQAHAWETAEVDTTTTATQLLGIVEDVSIQSDACSAVFIIFGISGCFAYGWTSTFEPATRRRWQVKTNIPYIGGKQLRLDMHERAQVLLDW